MQDRDNLILSLSLLSLQRKQLIISSKLYFTGDCFVSEKVEGYTVCGE